MIKDFIVTFIKHYGNFGLTIGLILEFIGLPVPGETMMSFFGFLTRKSMTTSFLIPILYSTAGTFIGSCAAYALSYKYGEVVVLKLGKYVFLTKDKLDKGNVLFEKYKVVLLLLGRFVLGVRVLIPYLSGISRINKKRFLILNFLGSIIWCSTFIGLGYFLGDKWHRIERIGTANILIICVLILFVILVFRLFKKHKFTILAITFPVLIFIKLSEDLIREELTVFDNSIYNFLTKNISVNIKFIMQLLSWSAYTPVLASITLIIFLIFKKNKKYSKYWLIIAINLAASDLITEIFKIVFHRDRPDILRLVEVSGYSFPSGHSMVGMSFYGLLFYLFFINLHHYKRYLAAIFFCPLIFFIGVSRVYLGVHYASDVLAGFSAGLAWLVIYITYIRRSVYFNKTPSNDQV